jgi:hypothetical protein
MPTPIAGICVASWIGHPGTTLLNFGFRHFVLSLLSPCKMYCMNMVCKQKFYFMFLYNCLLLPCFVFPLLIYFTCGFVVRSFFAYYGCFHLFISIIINLLRVFAMFFFAFYASCVHTILLFMFSERAHDNQCPVIITCQQLTCLGCCLGAI